MNFSKQLTSLILGFYREDPDQYRAIATLQSCQLSRRWGTLRINCADARTAEDLVRGIGFIREPVAKLRLARRLKIVVHGAARVFPVHVHDDEVDYTAVQKEGRSSFFF
jgi:hypothetical protein